MMNNFKMALETKKQEEVKTGKTKKELEKKALADAEANKEAAKTVQVNMLSQKEQMQKRLRERRAARSKAPRATSLMAGTALNNTLPLNFDDKNGGNTDNDNNLSGIKPVMQSSSLAVTGMKSLDSKLAEIEGDNTNQGVFQASVYLSPNKLNKSQRIDDTASQGNRSTTTTGGGLASKIGLAVSKILQNHSALDISQEDEVSELATLLDELNLNSDLTVKLSNQSKIIKFLNEAGDGTAMKQKSGVFTVEKDYKREVGKAKSEFGKFGFQSKLRLEMKRLMIDPKVKEIVDQSRQKLEKLQEEKDEEIEEFQEQHAENRFKAAKKIKDRFKLKITMAKKKNDTDEVSNLESQQKEELKKLDEKL